MQIKIRKSCRHVALRVSGNARMVPKYRVLKKNTRHCFLLFHMWTSFIIFNYVTIKKKVACHISSYNYQFQLRYHRHKLVLFNFIRQSTFVLQTHKVSRELENKCKKCLWFFFTIDETQHIETEIGKGWKGFAIRSPKILTSSFNAAIIIIKKVLLRDKHYVY